MIYPTQDSRAGLSEAAFEGKIADATKAIWNAIGALFTSSFRAAHMAPAYRHCHCTKAGK